MSLVVRALSLVLLLTAACSSPAQSWCANRSECGDLGNKSEDQCAADTQKSIDDAYTEPECERFAVKYEDMLACTGSLSCEEFSLDVKNSPCRAEIEDYNGALISNLGCLF